MTKEIKRNDPCPCGSGKKYKKCCGSPKLSARKITLVQGGKNSLQEKISSATKESISEAPSTLSGRNIQPTFSSELKKD